MNWKGQRRKHLGQFRGTVLTFAFRHWEKLQNWSGCLVLRSGNKAGPSQTTKLIRILGPQVRKKSWALPNTKLKCWSLACYILFETISFLLLQPDSDHKHLSCPPQLVSVKFFLWKTDKLWGFSIWISFNGN